jgi:hypothetical protein
MEKTLSKLIFKNYDVFDDFDFGANSFDEFELEHIKTNEINMEIENKIKFKIFDDIDSIYKKSNHIELIIKIPIVENIISINKIILADKIKKHLINIFIYIDGVKIFFNNTKKTFVNSKELIKNLELCICLDSIALNDIMNQNIIVNYSCVNSKKKIKYY